MPTRSTFSQRVGSLDGRRRTALIAALICLLNTLCGEARAVEPRFVVRFDKALRSEPFTGRVTLFFSAMIPPTEGEPPLPQPRFGPNWFAPEPMLSVNVSDWQPEADLVIAATAENVVRFPRDLAPEQLAGRAVQAVARFNPWERDVGNGPGNAFSASRRFESDETPQTLELTELIPSQPFPETEWSRELVVPSRFLSEFHKRDVALRACVTLPKSYVDDPTRRYPVLFIVPGFGGTHRMGRREQPLEEKNPGDIEFIRVTLDPSCPWGNHVFADSANNGPWGTALIQEFIPALDAAYRTDPRPVGRFLGGHSSGGWSSLWLQVSWPEEFNGTWSTAPDPVDFHDFQRIDLYADTNAWLDAEGNRRPIARRGDTPVLWFDSFDQMEIALGRGGQLLSFDAVFGPKGEDGQPQLAWSRKDGRIDPTVVEHWKRYDIVDKLRREWPALGAKLGGKLHVIMGDLDTFYLEGATKRLKTALEELNSDAVVEIVPGKDHGSLLTRDLGERIRREMSERYLATRGQ